VHHYLSIRRFSPECIWQLLLQTAWNGPEGSSDAWGWQHPVLLVKAIWHWYPRACSWTISYLGREKNEYLGASIYRFDGTEQFSLLFHISKRLTEHFSPIGSMFPHLLFDIYIIIRLILMIQSQLTSIGSFQRNTRAISTTAIKEHCRYFRIIRAINKECRLLTQYQTWELWIFIWLTVKDQQNKPRGLRTTSKMAAAIKDEVDFSNLWT